MVAAGIKANEKASQTRCPNKNIHAQTDKLRKEANTPEKEEIPEARSERLLGLGTKRLQVVLTRKSLHSALIEKSDGLTGRLQPGELSQEALQNGRNEPIPASCRRVAACNLN
ncbi:hypothetical protein ACFE04_029113 [Oxalis oulophora]